MRSDIGIRPMTCRLGTYGKISGRQSVKYPGFPPSTLPSRQALEVRFHIRPDGIKTIVDQDEAHGHFPDYVLSFDSTRDQVTFTPRAGKALPQETLFPMISNQALEKARTVAPGYDVYALKSDYLAFWDDKGQQPLKNADAAFLGWCKKRHERNPLR